jgi:hypothetical protein
VAPAVRRRQAVLAAVFFLALTILMTWPQALHLSDGMTDIWDAKLTSWVLEWDYHQTLRDPWNLFQAPFFHPARYVLAFSENLYGAAVFGFPLLAAGASTLLNYNALLLLGMFLSALSAWALARYLTGDAVASLIAGTVYAFLPWRLEQLPHVQFQWGAFLCLMLLFLLRYLESGRRRDAVAFGVCFAWNALSNLHYAIFSGFLVAIPLLWFAAGHSEHRSRRLRGALLALGLGTLAFVPFAIPYGEAARLYAMERHFGEMAFYSGRWHDFLSSGEKNRFYGAVTARWHRGEGDFFPGLAVLGLAAIAIWKVRREGAIPARAAVSHGRLRAARAVDVVCAVLAAVWIGARLQPGLRIGSLSLGDPGRLQVFLTAALLLRLILAFPGPGRYANLPDFLRRSSWDPRVLLLLAIGAAGVFIALGANTPYYRFLFQSFSRIFRAIRVPARGIVLFDLAVAVLAAWGFAVWSRRLAPGARRVWAGALLAILVLEYRAFPLKIYPVEGKAAAVYEWVRTAPAAGAIVELPLGLQYDYDYVFRQGAHGKPIVNGYSGFFPQPYLELQAMLRLRPIPSTVWNAMRKRGAALVVLHIHDTDSLERLRYVRAVRAGIAEGQLTPVASFPHGEGRDLVLRLSGETSALLPASEPDAEAASLLATPDEKLAPPFGAIDSPAEGAEVASGSGGYGWALDDSGVAEIRVASELGPGGRAWLGGARSDIAKVYPDYAGAERAGFGFRVPDLAPGPHTLLLTIVAQDGGETVLRRQIRVR